MTRTDVERVRDDFRQAGFWNRDRFSLRSRGVDFSGIVTYKPRKAWSHEFVESKWSYQGEPKLHLKQQHLMGTEDTGKVSEKGQMWLGLCANVIILLVLEKVT